MATSSAHPVKHLSPHHGDHGHPGKGATGITRTMALAALLVAILGLGTALFLLRPKAGPAAPSPEAFAEQMEQAAQGAPITTNLYGGTLRVERKNGLLTITADNIPPAICVSVGWKLVRRGLLGINGTVPLRVSAAKLSELCNQEDTNAVLTWTPKAAD